TASKYACVTSRASCARSEVSSTWAVRSFAAAVAFWPLTRPPVKTFCEKERPSVHELRAPKPTRLKSIPCADGQVLAAASAAARSAGVELADSGGVQSDCGLGVVLVSGPPPLASAENCERRARA